MCAAQRSTDRAIGRRCRGVRTSISGGPSASCGRSRGGLRPCWHIRCPPWPRRAVMAMKR